MNNQLEQQENMTFKSIIFNNKSIVASVISGIIIGSVFMNYVNNRNKREDVYIPKYLTNEDVEKIDKNCKKQSEVEIEGQKVNLPTCSIALQNILKTETKSLCLTMSDDKQYCSTKKEEVKK